MKKLRRLIFLAILLLLAACSPAPETQIHYDPTTLQFSGERALEIETDYVTRFPNRNSGKPNNLAAAEWFIEKNQAIGYECSLQSWEVINYSRIVPLRNAVCSLAGREPGEILIVAHHDHSPDTIEGADNDGSGIAILTQLAEIFAEQGTPRYTLVFVSTDGEEYGMLGTGHYVETHPDVNRIIAGLSLDNLGKRWYTNVYMWSQGQFKGFGPAWLVQTTRDAARAAGDVWVPITRAPLDQILDQAVPVSLWDQGPLVAAGVPALGIGGWNPPEDTEEVWRTYHSPDDLLEYQSPEVLGQSGLVAEALIRELLARDSFPEESGPYVYLENSETIFRGLPLWLIFLAVPALFFLGAFTKERKPISEKTQTWIAALPYFLSMWLPLFGGVLVTYLLVAVGLMDTYHLYPATPKDEPLFEPRWPAVIIFLASIAFFFWLARRQVNKSPGTAKPPTFHQSASLAHLVIGLSAVYIIILNPFSLLFLVPVTAWLLISGRQGLGRVMDQIFFLFGGLIVYALIYFFGFVILRNNWAVLWYLLMMFSIRSIGWPVAGMITAVLGAGLSLVVRPKAAS